MCWQALFGIFFPGSRCLLVSHLLPFLPFPLLRSLPIDLATRIALIMLMERRIARRGTGRDYKYIQYMLACFANTICIHFAQ
uniref:Putative secreted protein n=1 Tax=Anopheles darlingi TaxID=43151 RepID=A0A2M4DMF3_ANODA